MVVDGVPSSPSRGRPDSNSSPEACGLSAGQLQRYRECVARAKEQARAGELQAALGLLTEALALRPSERLERRVQRVQEALAAQEGEDEDEWVPVDGCELRLYRQLFERLHPHQRRGVAFLHRLYAEQRGGGILADDMGLGKTVQLLAFLSGMFDAGLVHCCLVLMPASLLANWLAEFATWTPGLRVKAFHGSKVERSRNLERVQRKGGVIITTYQLVNYNLDQLSHLDGRQFTWDYMVLDEAHKIKSQLSKTTKQVNAIPAKNRVLLTGTPVQNNLQEMWTLFDFACQGSLLGPLKTFKSMYENPITRAREKDATPQEKALGLRISESLMRLIQPYFLRRTKEGIQMRGGLLGTESEGQESPALGEILWLSRKNDLIVWIHLSQIQEEIYRKFVSSELIRELLQTKLSPLVQLNNLKKLCDHPRLLSKRIWEELGLGGGTEAGDGYDIRQVSNELLVQESGKLVFLLGLLERLQEEGHRTLVFSQSRKMLDIIQRVLTTRGFQLARMDGTMALPERQKVVENFQRCPNCSVFLLTTQVGGVGLTLTAADRVVIIDPSWNPATDAQAVDRAYRIGQTANVVIYRLVTCGSVEEKIYRRQIFKDSLIRQSVGERKNPFRYFSRQELRELFVLEDTRYSSTQRQLQTVHASQREMDAELGQHIAFLHGLPMFGVTHHNLVHSQDVAPDEENRVSDPASQQYIQERVQLAQELVAVGSQSQREPGWLHVPPSPLALKGRGRGRTVPEPDSRETPPPIDLTELPSDREMEDEVSDLSYREEGVPEPDSGETPPPIDLTELPSDRETEDEVSNLSDRGGGAIPEPDSRESPPPIDLMQLPSDRETEDEVSNLSYREGGVPELDSGETPPPIDLMQLPSDRKMEDEVSNLSYRGGGAIPELDSGETPPPIDLTELPSDRETEDEVSNLSYREDGAIPELDSGETPPPIDLTQLPSDRETDSKVSNLSHRFADLPVGSGNQDDSVVFVPSTTGAQRGSDFVFWDPGLRTAELSLDPTDPFQGMGPDGQDEAFSELGSHTYRTLLQSDFQLVLEDTMEDEGVVDSQQEEAAAQRSTSDSPGGESPAVAFSRKRRLRVINSDDEEQTEGLPGLPATGLALEALDPAAASTPKGLNLPPFALHNASASYSFSSRRSLVRSVIDEIEDVSEDEEGEGGGPPRGECAREVPDVSSEDPEPPASATVSEEETGSETFNPELASNEQAEAFAKAVEQLPALPAGAAGEGAESADPPRGGDGSLEDLESVIQGLTGLSTGAASDGAGSLQLPLDDCDSLLRQLAELYPSEGGGSSEPSLNSLMQELTGLCPGTVSAELLGECGSLVQEPPDPATGPPSEAQPPVRQHESLVQELPNPDTGPPSEAQPPVRQHDTLVEETPDLGTGPPSEGTNAEPLLGEYERLVKRGREQMELGELNAALGCMLQALDIKSGDPEVQLITIKLYRQLDRR